MKEIWISAVSGCVHYIELVLTVLAQIDNEVLLGLEPVRELLRRDLTDRAFFGFDDLVAFHLRYSRIINDLFRLRSRGSKFFRN